MASSNKTNNMIHIFRWPFLLTQNNDDEVNVEQKSDHELNTNVQLIYPLSGDIKKEINNGNLFQIINTEIDLVTEDILPKDIFETLFLSSDILTVDILESIHDEPYINTQTVLKNTEDLIKYFDPISGFV
jgi:hypothetical protein